MIRKLTCIECPQGCVLTVETDAEGNLCVRGNQCDRGEHYAKDEVQNPVRVLTSIVLAEGLPVKMIPVKTDRPIPKDEVFRAMKEIKKIKIISPLKVGDVVVHDFLDLNVNLISTRSVDEEK